MGAPPRRSDTPASCEWCAKPFYPFVRDAQRGMGRFCSRICVGRDLSARAVRPEQKVCNGCGVVKPIGEFPPRSDKRAGAVRGRCRTCYVAHRRPARQANATSVQNSNRRWAKKNPERHRLIVQAQKAVRVAIQKGHLVRAGACAACGASETVIEAAHSDYTQPLLVRWLCRPCHRRWDSAEPKTLTGVAS